MSRILACPFCREVYSDAELTVCPECDLTLEPIQSGEISEGSRGEPHPVVDVNLPWYSLGRGRGVLLMTAAVALVTMLAPWVLVRHPHQESLTGIELVASRGFWFGGGPIGWVVASILIVTRRTVMQMRGARVAVSALASVSFFQVLVLTLLPPGRHVINVDYQWGWGLYLNGVTGLLGMFLGATFGGSLPKPAALYVGDCQETSDGHTVH